MTQKIWIRVISAQISRAFGVSKWYQRYTNIVQCFTNGNTICTNGNANGTIGSANGTIGIIGKPMVPLISQWCHWLPMVPLVKLTMVTLGEPRTEPLFRPGTARPKSIYLLGHLGPGHLGLFIKKCFICVIYNGIYICYFI